MRFTLPSFRRFWQSLTPYRRHRIGVQLDWLVFHLALILLAAFTWLVMKIW